MHSVQLKFGIHEFHHYLSAGSGLACTSYVGVPPRLQGCKHTKEYPVWQPLKLVSTDFWTHRSPGFFFGGAIKNPNIEFVGINDLVPSENLAYLLKYDSTHGRYDGTVEAVADGIIVDGKKVPCMSARNPAELPWKDLGADYVVESTGLFTTFDTAKQHIDAGAKRSDTFGPHQRPRIKFKTLLVGVNHETF